MLHHCAPSYIKYDSYQFSHLFYGRVLRLALIKSDLKDLYQGIFPLRRLFPPIETRKAFELSAVVTNSLVSIMLASFFPCYYDHRNSDTKKIGYSLNCTHLHFRCTPTSYLGHVDGRNLA